MTSQLALLQSRRLLPMLLTQMTSGFNDNLFKSGFVMLVTFGGMDAGGLPAPALAVLAGGLLILPFLLFSSLAGQLADRHERSRLLCRLKDAELGIVLASGAALITGSLPLSLGVLFLLGTQSAFSSPIKYSLLPQHLAPDELVAGNAVMEAGTFLSILGGTLAGALMTSLAAGPALGAFLLLLLGVLGVAASRFVPAAPAPAPGLRLDWNLAAATARLLEDAAADRDIRAAILGASWFWLVGSIYLAELPGWIKDRLGGDGSVVTLFLAFFSVGVGAGASLCGRLLAGRVSAWPVPWSALAMALLSAALAFAGPIGPDGAGPVGVRPFLAGPSGWVALALVTGVAMAGGAYAVPLNAVMQLRSAPARRARVIAANNVMNALFMAGGAGAAALLLGLGLPVAGLFLIAAAGDLYAARALRRALA